MPSQKKTFRFKQFEVIQDRSAMKVGTDAVLLASWADISGAKHILDVGTGTGVIALICAQRNSSAIIEAIEIHEGSSDDAKENFEHSPWRTRLRLHTGDFLKIVSGEKFDLIISNPPYFTHSLRASDPSRSVARHDDSLPADAFFKQCKTLLSPLGKIEVIIPYNQLERWVVEASHHNLKPVRICHVFTMAHKEATRVMAAFALEANEEPIMESILIEKKPSEFSEAYKQLTKDFYTKW